MLKLCPICAAEYEGVTSACPECECPLVPSILDGSPQVTTYAASRVGDLAELCRPPSFAEAMLVKQLLEQSGIPAIVKGGHSLSLMPYLATAGELRVLVDCTMLEDARALYQAYFEGDGETDYIPEE